MDRTCINNHIINIQCDHGVLGNTLSTQLGNGSRKVVCLDRYNIATSYLLNVLRRYRPFEATVTYAYKFKFERAPISDPNAPLVSVNVDLTLQTNILPTYVGTGDGVEIAAYFQGLIDAGGLTIAYLTEVVGNVLYVYSYDPIATFGDVTLITSSHVDVTVGKTNLQNDLDEILNLWNCLTGNEICTLLTLAQNAAKTGKSLSGSGNTSNGGCNC